MSDFPMRPQRALVWIAMVTLGACAFPPAARAGGLDPQLGAPASQLRDAAGRSGGGREPPPPDESPAAGAGSDIDRLVERVFDRRRAAHWRQLGDFLLRETLAVAIEASPDSPLAGFRRTREYEWIVRDGWAIRSPVRVDGVVVGEGRRRGYERRWRRDERRRRAALDASDPEPEPRFVADFHYFLEWGLEPGDWYFVGRETVAGRDVVRIECYPIGDFREEAGERINRGIRKTSLLTLWVDPETAGIVQYAFENSGLDFLPFRWLARADGFEASMEMAPVGGVWMPGRMTLSARITTARGEIEVTVTQRFFDYREAETGARLVEPAGTTRR